MRKANIIIGPSYSGKYAFAEKYFPDYEILSVGQMQRDMEQNSEIKNVFEITLIAHQQIIESFIDKLEQDIPVVMLHTLYKSKRRIEYVKRIRDKFGYDIDIDIYMMNPNDEQIQQYIIDDKEKRMGSVEFVKNELRAIEIPSIDEGFDHVYLVDELGIHENLIKKSPQKVIDYNENLHLKVVHKKEVNKKIDIYGDEPFIHICETCGKTEILTSKQAFDNGWDFPGKNGVYSNISNNYGFGIISPRTCENCCIIGTAYWSLIVEKKSIDQLSEKQLQTIERIREEPEILQIQNMKEKPS